MIRLVHLAPAYLHMAIDILTIDRLPTPPIYSMRLRVILTPASSSLQFRGNLIRRAPHRSSRETSSTRMTNHVISSVAPRQNCLGHRFELLLAAAHSLTAWPATTFFAATPRHRPRRIIYGNRCHYVLWRQALVNSRGPCIILSDERDTRVRRKAGLRQSNGRAEALSSWLYESHHATSRSTTSKECD